MPITPAGKVTVASPGTPVSAAINMPPLDRNNKYKCHGVMFQALASNSGPVYIGTSEMDKDTLAKTFVALPIPTSTGNPSFSVALTISPNALCLNDFYIDADQAGDGVLISFLET